MKRRIALFLGMMIALCAGAAAAEDFDLAALNDGALLELMDRVQEEIVARRIAGTATLASGSYLCGRDVPAGSYVLSSLAAGDDWGNCTIYADEGEGDQKFWEILSAPEEGEEPQTFFITLDEGDVLECGVSFSLTIYPGVVFQ